MSPGISCVLFCVDLVCMFFPCPVTAGSCRNYYYCNVTVNWWNINNAVNTTYFLNRFGKVTHGCPVTKNNFRLWKPVLLYQLNHIYLSQHVEQWHNFIKIRKYAIGCYPCFMLGNVQTGTVHSSLVGALFDHIWTLIYIRADLPAEWASPFHPCGLYLWHLTSVLEQVRIKVKVLLVCWDEQDREETVWELFSSLFIEGCACTSHLTEGFKILGHADTAVS